MSSFSSMLLSLGEVFAELKATLRDSMPLVALRDWADKIHAYMMTEPSIDEGVDHKTDSKTEHYQMDDSELEPGLVDLTEEEAEEVRQEFFFTALLTLTVLLAFSALAVCQWV